MHNRVQRALARRERMRRSRDRAWMVFAGFGVAAVFGWLRLGKELLVEPRGTWWALLFYAALGAVSTYGAYRAFGAAQRLARRVDQAQPLEGADERERSVWDEIWGRRS